MQPEDVCKLEPCCLDPLLVRAHHKLFITLFTMHCLESLNECTATRARRPAASSAL